MSSTFRATPGPGERRIIIPDVHGNPGLLRELLREAGAVDEDDRKLPGTWVCQLGDLLHLGRGVELEQDIEAHRLAGRWIDAQLIGNHELPYLTGWEHAGFAGMREELPGLGRRLRAELAAGRWQVAAAADGWLITHAGLIPHMWLASSVKREERESIAALIADRPAAATLAERLNARLRERLAGAGPDQLFEWIGRDRWGAREFGGVFWGGWTTLERSYRTWLRRGHWLPRQIVGHTALKGAKPRRAADDHLICIDLAGIDFGWATALVREPGDHDWSSVVVQRRPRQPSRRTA